MKKILWRKNKNQTIKFSYVNKEGRKFQFDRVSVSKWRPEHGEEEKKNLASFFNFIMKYIGYSEYDKELVFNESVTEKEYDKLKEYLTKLRTNEVVE